MNNQPKVKKPICKALPFYGRRDADKKPLCAKCGRRTYRMQAGIPICSRCEADIKITFDGVRHVIDKTANTELAQIKCKEA